MDYSDKWGTDVETAVKLALEDLQATIDEVNVTVLEEPSRGFFGIGSKLAKVRVERKKPENKKVVEEEEFSSISAPLKDSYDQVQTSAPTTSAPVSRTRSQGQPTRVQGQSTRDRDYRESRDGQRDGYRDGQRRDQRRTSGRSGGNRRDGGRPNQRNRQGYNRDRRPRDRGESIDFQGPVEPVIPRVPDDQLTVCENHIALDFLSEVAEQMGLNLEISAKAGQDVLYIELGGQDSGAVIGKRGQTLDAIQYLTSLVVNKGQETYTRVVIDAENYRAKREKTLEMLALRLAGKVCRTRRSVRLEPMNPYERKVIHATLQNHPQVTTRSEGQDPYRRVIIELK